MAKPVKPLTDYQIKQAKAQEKEYTLTDGQGLLLRVRPSGAKHGCLNIIDRCQKSART